MHYLYNIHPDRIMHDVFIYVNRADILNISIYPCTTIDEDARTKEMEHDIQQ